ncbi:MAG: hypothetical protein HGA78_12355, partial [Nitrospirales bacterium]|nr:hypothetical protein [Nitrospirales bacterium]
MADTGGVTACFLENYQAITVKGFPEEPLDIAVNREGELYVLDAKTERIYRFDRKGEFLSSFGEQRIKGPVSIAVGREEAVYVACRDGFLRFSREGQYTGGGGFSGMGTPVIITADGLGGHMLNDRGEVYGFDDDGLSTGKVRLPEDAGPVVWIFADGCGRLYAGTATGVFVLVSEGSFTREKGFYYSKTLDSGTTGNRWHRLALKADIPADTAVDIYSHTSDDETLKDLVDGIIGDPGKPIEEKASLIDSAIPWGEPEKSPKDMLFRGREGRFLWLKLSLATYNDAAAPVLREMKVFSPRISYLSYLPAIYQEDPASRDFLERFLSIFESVFYELESDISNVTRYFDPDKTPPEFLRWLASWVNIAIEDDWKEETKRAFIKEAASLYTAKGTIEGISRFISLYTGKEPVILEHALAVSPLVLGGKFILGTNTTVVKTPVRGFRLGDDSIIGRAALRDIVSSPEEPFLASAFHFTVVLDLSKDERERFEKGLQRIISDGEPCCSAELESGLRRLSV